VGHADTNHIGSMPATAQQLLDAFESGSAIDPLTAGDPDLSVDRAYELQRQLVALHERRGRSVVGRKIGLTSPAIQQQLGVDSPDYGVIFDSHVFVDGAVVSRSASRMIAPRIEAELAFVLAEPIAGPGLDADRVLAATRAITPVFELIDSRIVDWRIALADTIADNASCFGVVEGTAVPAGAVADLAAVTVAIHRNDDVVASGTGSAVLGHPATAVAWLGNELARFGEELPAGQLLLSGSFTAAVDATPGIYRAVFSGPIPPVTVTVAP
jgi:2-keto-4-pentenoate hydratase